MISKIQILLAPDEMTDTTARGPLLPSFGKCFQSCPPKFFKWKTIRSLSKTHNMPYFILLISLTEITIYIGADESVRRALLFDARRRKEIWRFITYMFIHTDITHLLLNLIIQLLIGTPIELEQGHCKCAAIYFGGGLAGSIGASNFASFSLMAGASSGIYALLISQLSNIILNYDHLKFLKYRIFAMVILTMSDVIYILYHVYYHNNENPQIGWVAHAFGAVFGLILGFLLFKGNSKLKRPFKAASYILLLVLVLAVNYNYLKILFTLLEAPS